MEDWPFPKDHFRKIGSAAIVQTLSNYGLDKLSKIPEEGLIYMGLLNNALIDKMYTIGNTGTWVLISSSATKGQLEQVEGAVSALTSVCQGIKNQTDLLQWTGQQLRVIIA